MTGIGEPERDREVTAPGEPEGPDAATGSGTTATSSPNAARILTLTFVIGGLVVLGMATYLGAAIHPALYAVGLISLVDFWLAWAFANGRIGEAAERRRAAEASGDAAALAAEDPSYNPYARED